MPTENFCKRIDCRKGVLYILSEIVAWLEQCMKEMANKPIIRETLKLIFILNKKSLTNLSNNNKMKEEIASIILNKNKFETFKEIYNVLFVVCYL
jgi:hypothetical protein